VVGLDRRHGGLTLAEIEQVRAAAQQRAVHNFVDHGPPADPAG
jgi:hypothetical protein